MYTSSKKLACLKVAKQAALLTCNNVHITKLWVDLQQQLIMYLSY